MATVFVIFGATGDLSRKRIFPALFKLFKSNLLPENFTIFACARTPHTHESFAKVLAQTFEAKAHGKWPDFAKNIHYVSLDVAEDKNLTSLPDKIENFEKETDTCAQRIFYMAIAPNIVEKSIENLGKHGLHLSCQVHPSTGTKPRVIIEKPFGFDLASAQSLDRKLAQYFGESQIYRIDHYLGKETVQNIFAFRFANEIFEPVWNNQYIDHIQITAAEAIGVEKRGKFYDKTGALRDVVQNHLLQLVALTAMDEPENFDAESINAKKLDIIKNIKKLNGSEIANSTVRSQYDGYLNEEKISPNSQTETYALVKLFVENERWQNVPFYLITGKKLEGKVSSIIIQFKQKAHRLFKEFQQTKIPNHITIQIQPNEGIGIRLAAKKPGPKQVFEPVDMEFCYKTSFDTPQPEAYERLLLDVILGDQSLFLSQEIIEESWKIIDPIEEVWQTGKPKLAIYKPGTWGPKEADDLMEKDGRQFLAPLLTICKI